MALVASGNGAELIRNSTSIVALEQEVPHGTPCEMRLTFSWVGVVDSINNMLQYFGLQTTLIQGVAWIANEVLDRTETLPWQGRDRIVYTVEPTTLIFRWTRNPPILPAVVGFLTNPKVLTFMLGFALATVVVSWTFQTFTPQGVVRGIGVLIAAVTAIMVLPPAFGWLEARERVREERLRSPPQRRS